MQIDSINRINYNSYTSTFGVNLQSKKLRFKEDDFYVRIKGYGRNSGWAKKIIDGTNEAIQWIRDGVDFESILRFITFRVSEANQLLLDSDKREHTGILRTVRDWWLCKSDWSNSDNNLITRYSNHYKNRYRTYEDRFDYIVKHPLKNPYPDIELTRPKHDKDYYGKVLDHANGKYIPSAFKRVNSIYDNLYKKYIINEPREENLEEINSSIAEIRWILAHATPWERGSDAISNTFIRAIYKAMGIKAYPLKRGVSLDLEAYCTNLDEYKNKFSGYFLKKPAIVD